MGQLEARDRVAGAPQTAADCIRPVVNNLRRLTASAGLAALGFFAPVDVLAEGARVVRSFPVGVQADNPCTPEPTVHNFVGGLIEVQTSSGNRLFQTTMRAEGTVGVSLVEVYTTKKYEDSTRLVTNWWQRLNERGIMAEFKGETTVDLATGETKTSYTFDCRP